MHGIYVARPCVCKHCTTDINLDVLTVINNALLDQRGHVAFTPNHEHAWNTSLAGLGPIDFYVQISSFSGCVHSVFF